MDQMDYAKYLFHSMDIVVVVGDIANFFYVHIHVGIGWKSLKFVLLFYSYQIRIGKFVYIYVYFIPSHLICDHKIDQSVDNHKFVKGFYLTVL